MLNTDLQLPLQGGELTRRILGQNVGAKQSAGQVLKMFLVAVLSAEIGPIYVLSNKIEPSRFQVSSHSRSES